MTIAAATPELSLAAPVNVSDQGELELRAELRLVARQGAHRVQLEVYGDNQPALGHR